MQQNAIATAVWEQVTRMFFIYQIIVYVEQSEHPLEYPMQKYSAIICIYWTFDILNGHFCKWYFSLGCSFYNFLWAKSGWLRGLGHPLAVLMLRNHVTARVWGVLDGSLRSLILIFHWHHCHAENAAFSVLLFMRWAKPNWSKPCVGPRLVCFWWRHCWNQLTLILVRSYFIYSVLETGF